MLNVNVFGPRPGRVKTLRKWFRGALWNGLSLTKGKERSDLIVVFQLYFTINSCIHR